MVPTVWAKSCTASGSKDVPSHQRRGHSQMAADQKVHGVPAKGIEAQPLEDALHRFQAAIHMALDGHAFPNVVKQQRKIQQFGMFQSGKNVAESALQFAASQSQPVQIFDGDQRMFIHRVPVVIVANHQGIDGLKFLEQQNQQPQPVHRAQRRRRMRQCQNLAEILPQVRTGREPLLDPRERRFDCVFGFGRQFEIVPGNQFKQPEHDFGIFNRSRLGQGHAPIHNAKFRGGKGRPADAQKAGPNRFGPRNFVKQNRQPVDGARMAKINTHPVIRGRHRLAVKPDAFGRGFRLQFVGQPIQIAALLVVQKTAHGVEKVNCIDCVRTQRSRQQPGGIFPFAGMFHLRDLREPARHLIVPQAAGTILDIGFEMKNRLAVFFVPGAGETGEFLHQILGFPSDHARQNPAPEPLEEVFIPANVPAVQKGNIEFDVASMKFPALGESPGGRADSKV